MPALLECSGLSKHYGTLRVLDQVSFTLDAGRVLGIGGPNGSGKSTLADIVCGLTRASGGNIRLAGRPLGRLPAHRVRRRGLARTFQIDGLFAGLSAREHVLLAAGHGGAGGWPGAWLNGWRTTRAVTRAADDALAAVGLAQRSEARPGSLSAFERRRLALAMALTTQPRVLVLDEPVGGLNEAERAAIRDVVADLVTRGTALLVIEHVIDFLTELADTVVILHHGSVLFSGPPQRMAADPGVVEHYLGAREAQRLRARYDA